MRRPGGRSGAMRPRRGFRRTPRRPRRTSAGPLRSVSGRARRSSRGVLPLPSDHDEEPALPLSWRKDLHRLDDAALERRAGRLRIEQAAAGEPVVLRAERRNAAHEVEPRLVEPAQYLAGRVPGLVRMAVLVREPRAALLGIGPRAA